MSSLEIAVLIAGFATMTAIAFFALRTQWRARSMRLMRCPETGAVAFVGAEKISRGEGTVPEVTVRSCDLWPKRKDCARGCLERYEQTAPGFRIRVEALRPFDGP
mgnify:CR=1 FL=1